MRSGEICNWLLVLAAITFSVIAYILIRCHKRMTALLSLALVPPILLTLLSMPPLSPMFISRYVIYAMAALPMAVGVGIVLLTNEPIKKRNKKKRPVVSPRLIGLAALALMACSSAIGLATVYAKGNYNMDTGSKSTSKNVYELILGLDAGANLPIVSNSTWLYYDLAAYTSAEHPVLFINEKASYEYGSTLPLKESYFGRIDDLDGWLAEHDSFWYVGKAPTKAGQTYIKFPREGWRVAEVVNQQFDEHSDVYQILKLERE